MATDRFVQASTSAASRRSLLAGGVGAAAAFVLSALGRATPVKAGSDGDVINGADNTAVAHRTFVHNTHSDVSQSSNDLLVDALFGFSENNGAGIAGQSTEGVGVKGYVGPIPMPDTLGAGIGVYGKGPLFGVYGESHTGVLGFSRTGSGVYGDGRNGAAGVYGASTEGNGVGVDGYADGDSTAVAVKAEAASGAIALYVDGPAHFTRSGTAMISTNKTSVVVALAGVKTTSMIFAVMAKNVSGRYVRAVVPASGQFTIYLNRALTAGAPVSWFVLD